MEISGNVLADQIRPLIKAEADKLISNGIRPHMAIITLGEEEGWETYVNQKLKWAEKLSIKASHFSLENTTTDKVVNAIELLNADTTTHGIIVQRPLPAGIDKQVIIDTILPQKDVDGFRADSPFQVPVWMAVKYILEYISTDFEDSLISFLKGKKISVIGKGETAGAPIISGLQEIGTEVQIIDTSTQNPHELIQKSDIVISCVGKKQVIKKEDMHKDQIIIGVGIGKEDKKLHGDFSNEDAKESEIVFTPTPGGVGPLNLTFLLQNVLQAAQFQR